LQFVSAKTEVKENARSQHSGKKILFFISLLLLLFPAD
jgi:hypothetical protein